MSDKVSSSIVINSGTKEQVALELWKTIRQQQFRGGTDLNVEKELTLYQACLVAVQLQRINVSGLV